MLSFPLGKQPSTSVCNCMGSFSLSMQTSHTMSLYGHESVLMLFISVILKCLYPNIQQSASYVQKHTQYSVFLKI